VSIFSKVARLAQDAPPEYAFEISEVGIAWAALKQKPVVPEWTPLDHGVLSVTPLKDNVLEPGVLETVLRGIVPPNGSRRQRPVAVILPDYCARVAVLDFDNFPTDPQEQKALVRFQIKKVAPFDVDNAVIGIHPQARHAETKRIDVLVVALAMEVAARYEAPFKAAGLHPGFVTLSWLSALPLPADDGRTVSPVVLVKLSGRALTVAVLSGATLRMVRSVELSEVTDQELLDVLLPTFAYVEDEFKARPQAVRLCGFPPMRPEQRLRWSTEIGAPLATLTSKFGAPGQYNAGLMGYMETTGVG
jgi:type IV pilus assembly protein PilM